MWKNLRKFYLYLFALGVIVSKFEISVGNDTNFVMVAAGENHNIYLSEEGKVYSSGNNVHGQLGCGEEE